MISQQLWEPIEQNLQTHVAHQSTYVQHDFCVGRNAEPATQSIPAL